MRGLRLLQDARDRVGQSVRIAGLRLPIVSTFGDVPVQTGLAYWGSSGFLEIALNQGNAASVWSIWIDTPVQVRFGN